MNTPLTFKVDVSRTYRNKEGYGPGKGYRLNTSFQTETVTPESFIEDIVKPGWPYTMVFNHERWPVETGAAARGVKTPKHTENFISRQELTGDFDNKQAKPGVIAQWLHDSFFSQYGYAFVESVNSIPGQAEKGHPTLIFDRPITCPKLYRECAKALAWKYPQLDQGIHNIDRTIFNAVGACVHLLGNICPFDVFEAEVLTPYREHLAEQAGIEAEYQKRRAAELEKARAEGRIRKDAGAFENYLASSLDGIFRHAAQLANNRHKGAIYWSGWKIGEYKAADWTRPYMPPDHELESRIVEAARVNGYLATYAHGNEAEVLRTFNDGRRFGSASPAPEPEIEARPIRNRGSLPRPPGPKEQARLAVRETYLTEARAERTEKEAQQQARQAELQRRFKAGDCVNFEGDEEIDPDQIEEMRTRFTSAKKWRAYVIAHWPDVDEDEQFRIKLAENNEARPGKCGEWRRKTLPNGQVFSTRWTCGACEGCLKRSVWIYRRALNEIQGIPYLKTTDELLPNTKKPREEITGEFGGLPVYKGRPYVPANGAQMVPPADDDPSELQRLQDKFDEAAARQEHDPPPEAPRENAPPLPQVKGDLSIVRVYSDMERARLGRELRLAGVNYKAFPVPLEDGPAYDFIINDDRGDPLGLISDERIALWVKGVESKRAAGPNKKQRPQGASGPLLPSLKELQQRYREALPYEVVCPELDDEGEPVDPDIFVLELPDIGTTARLPGVTVEFEVHDAETLQAALLEIHQEQWRILGRRGAVNYGVCIHKKFYTRYLTLPRMLADFNAEQAAIRQRRRKK